MVLTKVYEELGNLYLDGALAQRTISLEMIPAGDKFSIIAWQCNMAYMKNADLKLPTVIKISLDSEFKVSDVQLMDNFKGSQGIPCSQPYLNRIMKSRLEGISFLTDETILKDEFIFHCRHIFELIAAAITFLRYCKDNLKTRNTLHEQTKAFVSGDGLKVTENLKINDTVITAEEKLIFGPEDLCMQANGKLGKVKEMRCEAEAYFNEEELIKKTEEIKEITGNTNVVMSIMKLLSVLWKAIGKKLNVRRNFYFTNLVPSSLYGVLMQATALKLFPNNYNYFQHALAGLQRSEDRPLCVGMAKDIGELKKFYPEFKDEDFFG